MTELAHTEKTPDPASDPEAPSGPSRGTTTRRALLCAGCALPLLAACGSTSSPTAAGATPSPPAPSPSATKSKKQKAPSTPAPPGGLVATSAVPVGGGVVVYKHGYVVTQPAKGVFHGFSDICTHRGCMIGAVYQGKIICPCHGSEYSIKDGSVLRGPATRALPAKGIKVHSGWVFRA